MPWDEAVRVGSCYPPYQLTNLPIFEDTPLMLVQHRTFWKIRPPLRPFKRKEVVYTFPGAIIFPGSSELFNFGGLVVKVGLFGSQPKSPGRRPQKCGVLPRTSLKSDRWEDRWEDDRRPIFYLGVIDLNMFFRFIPQSFLANQSAMSILPQAHSCWKLGVLGS